MSRMVHPILLPALLVAPLLLVGRVLGSSTGALACPAGEAAVGGLHLSGSVTDGPLNASTMGLELLLDGTALTDAGPNEFAVGVDHSLTLQASKNGTFRGFLLRLGSGPADVATAEALSVDEADAAVVQIASTVCVENEGVGGLTHSSNSEKISVSATLRLDEVDTEMPLDVTVVVQNRDGQPIHHYSRYMLNAVAGSAQENGYAPPTTSASTAAGPGHLPTVLLLVFCFALFGSMAVL